MPFLTLVRLRASLGAVTLAAFTLAASPATKTTAVAKKPVAHAAAKPATAKHVTAKKPAPKAYRPHLGLAPADEYFGRLGMSILGVRSKVKDLGLDADLHPDHAKAVLGSALWVEDAMRDWAKKYPFDRWLPRYAYALEVMYERMPGDDAHKRAVKQIAYLTAYFPQTQYGRVGRAKLALGVPTPDPSQPPAPMSEVERLALLDGKVTPTMPPTPKPTPTPATAPSATPVEPAAGPSPAPAPSVQPAASPTPSASAKP